MEAVLDNLNECIIKLIKLKKEFHALHDTIMEANCDSKIAYYRAKKISIYNSKEYGIYLNLKKAEAL